MFTALRVRLLMSAFLAVAGLFSVMLAEQQSFEAAIKLPKIQKKVEVKTLNPIVLPKKIVPIIRVSSSSSSVASSRLINPKITPLPNIIRVFSSSSSTAPVRVLDPEEIKRIPEETFTSSSSSSSSSSRNTTDPPDLIVTSITQTDPAGAIPSGHPRAMFTFTVGNIGLGYARRTTATVTQLRADGRSLGTTFESVEAVDGGQSVTDTYWLTQTAYASSSRLAAGDYILRICANNADGPAEETDTTNNCAETPFTVSAALLPDYAIRSITVRPENPLGSDEINFNILFANDGEGTAPATRISYTLDPEIEPFGRDGNSAYETREMSPGGTSTVRIYMNRGVELDPGTHLVRICVNQGWLAPEEEDTTNNCAEQEFSVAGQAASGTPDLTVTSVTQTDPVGDIPSGHPTSIFGFTVRNIGDGYARRTTATVTQLRADGRSLGTTFESVEAVNAGQSVTDTYWLRQTAYESSSRLAAGDYILRICANNADGPLTEADTTNNCAETPFTVSAGLLPDYAIRSITVRPANPRGTDEINFNILFANDGAGTAPATRISYMLDPEIEPFGRDGNSAYETREMSPGGTSTVRIYMNRGVELDPGTHLVRICVNQGWLAPEEEDTTNNCAEQEFTVVE